MFHVFKSQIISSMMVMLMMMMRVRFSDYLSSSQISVIDKGRVSRPLYLYEAFDRQQKIHY
jgi:hypothetical protein